MKHKFYTQLCLLFYRIEPPDPPENKLIDTSKAHSLVLDTKTSSLLLNLLKQSPSICYRWLQIVSLMLREQNPATLASSALQRSVEEKEKDEKELLEIRQREIMEKQSKIKKYAGSR